MGFLQPDSEISDLTGHLKEIGDMSIQNRKNYFFQGGFRSKKHEQSPRMISSRKSLGNVSSGSLDGIEEEVDKSKSNSVLEHDSASPLARTTKPLHV